VEGLTGGPATVPLVIGGAWLGWVGDAAVSAHEREVEGLAAAVGDVEAEAGAVGPAAASWSADVAGTRRDGGIASVMAASEPADVVGTRRDKGVASVVAA